MADIDMDMVRRFAGAPDADQDLLAFHVAAATEWYERAGVPAETEGDLYAFWVANLAAWFYDNRGNADGNANIPGYIVQSVHQLRRKKGAGA